MSFRTPSTPPRRHLRAVALGIAALLLGACSQTPDDAGGSSTTTGPPSPEATTTAPSVEPTTDATDPGATAGDEVASMTFTDCEADRYTVGYPADWNTNSDDGLLEPCTIFHPGDIEAPEQPRDRDLHHAVSMYVDEVAFDDRLTADDPGEVIEERETTVDGRRALVLEYRSTGQALTPEGEHSYSWAIDLDGQILVATTSSVGDTDYERDKRVLDRMVTEELTIHDRAAGSEGATTTEESTG